MNLLNLYGPPRRGPLPTLTLGGGLHPFDAFPQHSKLKINAVEANCHNHTPPP